MESKKNVVSHHCDNSYRMQMWCLIQIKRRIVCMTIQYALDVFCTSFVACNFFCTIYGQIRKIVFQSLFQDFTCLWVPSSSQIWFMPMNFYDRCHIFFCNFFKKGNINKNQKINCNSCIETECQVIGLTLCKPNRA